MPVQRIREPVPKKLHCDHCGEDKVMRLRFIVNGQSWCSGCYGTASARGQVPS